MSTNILFSLKVWLTSVVVAPVFYLIIMYFKQVSSGHNYDSTGDLYYLIVIYGFLFSFLTWLVFLISIMLVSRYSPNELAARCLICVTGIVMTIATFMLTIFQHRLVNDGDFIYLLAANCFCIGAGSWIYKLKLYKHPKPDAQLL